MRVLGDEGGEMRVRVNEAYGLIHRGEFMRASGIIEGVMKWAEGEGDKELHAICRAAKRFGGNVERVGEMGGRGCTEDELYRIRVVKE